jgi:transposase
MSLNKTKMRILESYPNVIHVSDKSITYARAFKLAAVKAYREGKTPQEIFVEAGFNLNIINPKNLSDCLKRWRTPMPRMVKKDFLRIDVVKEAQVTNLK